MNDVLGVGKVVEKAIDPITDIVKKMAGPAAEEIGLTLRDSVKVYRAKRQYQLFEKMKKFFDKNHLTPNPIELKVLLPALDYASVEADENLHTMWATLLSSAAIPGAKPKPYPAFVETLRQLSKEEALFLSILFNKVTEELKEHNHNNDPAKPLYPSAGHRHHLRKCYLDANGLTEDNREASLNFIVTMENIVRLGILFSDHEEYRVTGFGLMFICLSSHEPGCWERKAT